MMIELIKLDAVDPESNENEDEDENENEYDDLNSDLNGYCQNQRDEVTHEQEYNEHLPIVKTLTSKHIQEHNKMKRILIISSILLFCTISIVLFRSYIASSPSNNSNWKESLASKLNLQSQTKNKYNDEDEETTFSSHHETDEEDTETMTGDEIPPLEQALLLRDHQYAPPPFSTLDPVKDLSTLPYNRPNISAPGSVFGPKYQHGQRITHHPLPTNLWYENIILLNDEQKSPNNDNQVYTVPYVVSFNGLVSGIKLESTRLLGMEEIVQVTFVNTHGLTLGAAESFGRNKDHGENRGVSDGIFGNAVERRYIVMDDDDDDDDDGNDNNSKDTRNNRQDHSPLTPLGITIKWLSVCFVLFCFVLRAFFSNYFIPKFLLKKLNHTHVEMYTYGYIILHSYFLHLLCHFSIQKAINEDDAITATTKTLRFKSMSSSIVRGMPYGTMNYRYDITNGDFSSILPTVVSEIHLSSPPIADSRHELKCSNSKDLSDNGSKEYLVHKSVKITFLESDITWLVFYSHPVYVRCYDMSQDTTTQIPFVLQAIRLANTVREEQELKSDFLFTSRIALMNNCTLGKNPTHCKDEKPSDMSHYDKLLHKHADVYPGINTKIDYTFFSHDSNVKGDGAYAYLQYDWDARHVRNGTFTPDKGVADAGLLMYSLPHHRDIMHSQSSSPSSFEFENGKTYCTPSLNGDACIVDGVAWALKENLDGQPSFFAPRPPMASTIRNLAKAINQDIQFRIPGYYSRGAGDTYFSGKILAKLSRILLVAYELKDICSRPIDFGHDYIVACKDVKLFSDSVFNEALDNLRVGTEVWINGEADTPFVYDDKWGGICSCGCYFNSETKSCDNSYPDCPAFSDPGLDFGHGKDILLSHQHSFHVIPCYSHATK